MTDLERLWDDLPTGPAPVADILRQGRAQEGVRRRRARGPLRVAVALGAVGAAFVAGVQVAGPGGVLSGSGVGEASRADGGTGQLRARPVAFQADLKPAASCDELLATLRQRGSKQVSAWGWEHGGPVPVSGLQRSYAGAGGVSDGPVPLPAQAESMDVFDQGQASSATGTNVQENGVDEPDTVKTDGRRLVVVRGSELHVYDLTGAAPRRVGTLRLPRVVAGELLLVGDRVVVVGGDPQTPTEEASGSRSSTRVVTVSIDDPAKPRVAGAVTYEGAVVTARQHGTTVRLVLAGLPDLGFVTPGTSRDHNSALAANRRAVASSTIDDWLPSYDAGDGPQRLVDCRDVAVPEASLGLDLVTIVGFDAGSAMGMTEPSAIAVAGAARIAYASDDHLYLASSATSGWGGWGGSARAEPGGVKGFVRCLWTCGGSATTHLFDFELDGVFASHVASGEVSGRLADRWSMDSVDGVLRIAVEDFDDRHPATSVLTVRREGAELVPLGRVDGLGKNETLQSVRWFDDVAYLVTFRQMDPLYAVDLSDVRHPTLAGELKIPGFSSYLHPVGDGRLLGIGQGGHAGADGTAGSAGLFDVSDLAHPRQLDTAPLTRLRWTEPMAASDPRAFTWLPDRRTAITGSRAGEATSLAVIRIEGDTLKERLIPYGDSTRELRTLPVADGRVVVVTDDAVRFLGL